MAESAAAKARAAKEDELAKARLDDNGAPPAREEKTHEEMRDERVAKAMTTDKLEVRPLTHPGVKAAVPEAAYEVDEELRQQWPGIKLGDDKE